MTRKRSSKRKLCFHKIFNIISILFLLTCISVYGYRFITLYLENNKKEDVKQIADTIKDNNTSNDNFKNINGDYYFSSSDVNNYIKYSNLLWRIIKVDKKGNVVIAYDGVVTSLAKGNSGFKDSSIYSWLNKSDDENTGIFESVLNDTAKYLSYTKACVNDETDIKKITCDKYISKTYVTIPTLLDYVNTGSSTSFLNSGSYYYLLNNGEKGSTWCVDSEGKISTSKGDDIIGIKPVVTIKNLTMVKSGDGSKGSPYEFEDGVSSNIGDYVKLGNDVWQVYGEDKDNLKLVLKSYLKVNDKIIENKYSKSGYVFNVSEYGSLAYYLNGKYLNSLVYKNILEEFDFGNGVYKNDYKEVLKSKVKAKVGLVSVGDIMFNQEDTDYFLSTGTSDNSVYIYQGEGKLHTSASGNMLSIVPTISIKKSLVSEHGTVDSPYEVKYE